MNNSDMMGIIIGTCVPTADPAPAPETPRTRDSRRRQRNIFYAYGKHCSFITLDISSRAVCGDWRPERATLLLTLPVFVGVDEE